MSDYNIEIIPPDMRAELEKFDHVAEQAIFEFVAPIESQEPPSIIYHYTNDVGLKGILESGNFWFTDIFNLNDPSELSHGLSHAVNILKSKAAKDQPECKLFTDQFAEFVEQGERRRRHIISSVRSVRQTMSLASGAPMPIMVEAMLLGLTPKLLNWLSPRMPMRQFRVTALFRPRTMTPSLLRYLSKLSTQCFT